MAAPSDPDPGLFRKSVGAQDSMQVECLRMTFDSEDARREHFLARLKEKLYDAVHAQNLAGCQRHVINANHAGWLA